MAKFNFLMALLLLTTSNAWSQAEMFQSRAKGETITCGTSKFDRTADGEILKSKIVNPFGERLSLQITPYATSLRNRVLKLGLGKDRNSVHPLRKKFRKSQALFKNQNNLLMVRSQMAAIPDSKIVPPNSGWRGYAITNVTPQNESALFNDEYSSGNSEAFIQSAPYLFTLRLSEKVGNAHYAEGILVSTAAARLKHHLKVKFRCVVHGN